MLQVQHTNEFCALRSNIVVMILLCGMCRCMGSTYVFCTVDQRNLVYMHTSPNVYASWVVPPSGATRATVSTGRLNYFSNPVALQGMPF